jgi:hypothetical protein
MAFPEASQQQAKFPVADRSSGALGEPNYRQIRHRTFQCLTFLRLSFIWASLRVVMEYKINRLIHH